MGMVSSVTLGPPVHKENDGRAYRIMDHVVFEGTLCAYPSLGCKNALTLTGANFRQKEATDRACKCPTIFKEVIASKNAILKEKENR